MSLIVLETLEISLNNPTGNSFQDKFPKIATLSITKVMIGGGKGLGIDLVEAK